MEGNNNIAALLNATVIMPMDPVLKGRTLLGIIAGCEVLKSNVEVDRGYVRTSAELKFPDGSAAHVTLSAWAIHK